MYKVKVIFDKKGNKRYGVYRDGKLKYCGESFDSAQRVCHMFYNFFRLEGIAI